MALPSSAPTGRPQVPQATPRRPYVATSRAAGRVVIELDGGQHTDQLAYDRARDEYFRERGFHVLRFWNDDVMRRMDDVLDAIAVALDG